MNLRGFNAYNEAATLGGLGIGTLEGSGG